MQDAKVVMHCEKPNCAACVELDKGAHSAECHVYLGRVDGADARVC